MSKYKVGDRVYCVKVDFFKERNPRWKNCSGMATVFEIQEDGSMKIRVDGYDYKDNNEYTNYHTGNMGIILATKLHKALL